MECADLRRAHSHLRQGTRPSKKATNIPDVKKYLQSVTIANDGLLVVRNSFPFQTATDRIVVPRAVISGLLTAIHIRFCHPSSYQMKRLMSRYFFALGIEHAIQSVVSACQQCSSLKALPKNLQTQTTSTPPESVGTYFAADVMRRYKQCVLVLRETVTSFTCSRIIPSEKHADLKDALIILCAEVRNLGESGCIIRVDCAPGLAALCKDKTLDKYGITLELGRVKNVNKNPVAERAIEELGRELLNIVPEGGPISASTLAIATSNMNMRIRRGGLSSRELWTQRDQITGDQLPVNDQYVICDQLLSRSSNHAASAQCKARSKVPCTVPDIQVGDLVFLHKDRDKTRARDRYIVTQISDEWCKVRKFVKSQFRSKVYDVLISECYPVIPTVLSGPSDPQGVEYTYDKSDDLSECEEFSTSDYSGNIHDQLQNEPPDERLALPAEASSSTEDSICVPVETSSDSVSPHHVITSANDHTDGASGGSPCDMPPVILTAPPVSSELRRSSRGNKGVPPRRFRDEFDL
jgi:hypothetical protein